MISVRYFQPGPRQFSPLPLSAWTQVCQRFEAKNLAKANTLHATHCPEAGTQSNGNFKKRKSHKNKV